MEQSAKQDAYARIPVTTRDHVGTAILATLALSFLVCIFLDFRLFPLWVIIAVVGGWVAAQLQGPRDTAMSNLAVTTLRNSVSRVDQEQQEYERFYLTTDWRNVRRQVIERDGNVCNRCKLQIQDSNELTVDHIKPRSKYPELALVLSNMQVLCRRCNSSKGVG